MNYIRKVKMGAQEVRSQYWILGSSIGFAITIPLIIYKIFKGICLRRSYNKLSGKVVVITGASSGLGEALAHEFYKRGCQLVLCSRRRQELDRVRTDLLKIYPTVPTHHPIIMPMDLSDINSLSKVIDDILELTGRIDILVNNGGISHRGTVLETKPDVDIKIMLVNYFGAAALTKAVLRSMISQHSGHIVQVSSIQGLIGIPHRSAYAASKHALQAFSDCLRAEVSEHNIDVTVVSPGYIKTRLSLNAVTASGTAYGQMDKSTEQGQSPSEIAEEIVKAVVQKKKEAILAELVPKMGVFLRKYLPDLYFYAMARRAKVAS
ncbi:dehydrogenase [Oryctes borbonicus]|uniref:Dehydrogenase n=1 Tax=Oryctes borbonicus TaxID=1629725 RepID=A0A0T6B6M8_9SCAR|nr:dehydrogenase [Oryctes borbonicus]